MSISRTTPDIGYIEPAFYNAVGISQTVRAGNTVYFSGIAPVRGEGESVAAGDIAGQLAYVFDVLGKCLQAEGLTLRNLVSTTLFCTDIQAASKHVDLFRAAFGAHPPTSTWVEVKALASPDFMVELLAVAVDA